MAASGRAGNFRPTSVGAAITGISGTDGQGDIDREAGAPVLDVLITRLVSRVTGQDPASHPWRVGDQFADETGCRRTVRGVSEIVGRNRYLELLA